MFLREGYLAPLQSCESLDDAVLQVAATIPFDGQDLKPETFVQRLRDSGVDVAGIIDRHFVFRDSCAEQHHAVSKPFWDTAAVKRKIGDTGTLRVSIVICLPISLAGVAIQDRP